MPRLTLLVLSFPFLVPFLSSAQHAPPAMKEAFLTKLKASIAHHDPRQFAELMDLDRKPNPDWVKKMMTQAGPYDAIYSDAPRKYRFVDLPLGKGTIHTMDMSGIEDVTLATTLEVTFNFTLSHTNGSNKGYVPLIVKDGKLLMVDVIIVTL